MARTFGECEINIPDGFVVEVMTYIEKWKSTQRYQRAVQRAKDKKYVATIGQTLATHDLPPQFFYLAMQESNFNVEACGPKTRWGIAKGMWQFIPDTAKRYGLKIGPLAKQRKPDPKDDRHNPRKATQAAARYLRDIYQTDAQASGLLVMASYNWGENRVIRLIRKMAANPKDRNFWNLLINYREKIPKETYDYVFYIFSAAVIGQNPKLFGFDFENPLATVEL
jgi:soluble lytic murein transglycosylase-like protein